MMTMGNILGYIETHEIYGIYWDLEKYSIYYPIYYPIYEMEKKVKRPLLMGSIIPYMKWKIKAMFQTQTTNQSNNDSYKMLFLYPTKPKKRYG